jgi:hypothetical protein
MIVSCALIITMYYTFYYIMILQFSYFYNYTCNTTVIKNNKQRCALLKDWYIRL